MLRKIMYAFIRPRHPWRSMQFDELSEIYTSMMMRSLGFSLMGIFVPVYLYVNGVGLADIFLFFTLFFLLRIPVSYLSAFVIGRIGPKHSIAISTMLLVSFLSMLLTYNQFQWPLLSLAFFFTLSNGLFFIAYDTDFSKIKHTHHGGKELGYLYIFERLGSALGPFVGGLIASIFAPEATIILAILVLLGSIVPLMLTNEPVRLHQKISFKGFKWGTYSRDYASIAALNIEHALSTMAWPLFATVLIFEDEIFAKVGAIVALGMVVSIFAARLFGHIIDLKQGLVVLRYGVILNTLLHLIRPFIQTATGAVIMSVAAEPTALAVRMPLIKGQYDEADSARGFRIVYFATSQIITSSFKAVIFFALYIVGLTSSAHTLFVVAFVFAAVASCATLIQRFPALKKV